MTLSASAVSDPTFNGKNGALHRPGLGDAAKCKWPGKSYNCASHFRLDSPKQSPRPGNITDS